MYKYRIILIFILFVSCKTQEKEVFLKQRISDDLVYITPDIYAQNRDSLKIDIPLEFLIKNNSNKNYDYVETTFFIDKKYVSLGDFRNVNKVTKEVKYDEDWELPSGKSEEIISRIKTLYINLEDTKEIFKKYSINKDPEKFRDSAKLISYKQFRKDFPNVIKKMEKVPDSIEITTSNKEEKFFRSKRFKINW